MAFIMTVGACGGADTDSALLEAEGILTAAIPGTTNGRTITEGGAAPRVTRLYDVTGDWVAVSVAIANAARAEGWTVESINCVGTGNDVIARKEVAGSWLLLESGAGTRGAGLIVSFAPTQEAPRPLSSSGNCPRALHAAAGG